MSSAIAACALTLRHDGRDGPQYFEFFISVQLEASDPQAAPSAGLRVNLTLSIMFIAVTTSLLSPCAGSPDTLLPVVNEGVSTLQSL